MNLIIEIDKEIEEKTIQDYVKYLEAQMDENRLFTIVIVDDKYIHKLNLEFREKNYATDVLTFVENTEEYLGDIIISYDKIIEQAKQYGHSLQREFLFLITHGYLHLLGYDHLTEEEEKKMFDLQKKLLEGYGVKR